MSKSIKISEGAYNGLHEIQRPRESLSEVVERLLAINTLLEKATPLMQSERVRLERRLETIDSEKTAHG